MDFGNSKIKILSSLLLRLSCALPHIFEKMPGRDQEFR